jgi:hypothetical protein
MLEGREEKDFPVININSSMARRDMTDVATVVMEIDRGHVVEVDCSVCTGE